MREILSAPCSHTALHKNLAEQREMHILLEDVLVKRAQFRRMEMAGADLASMRLLLSGLLPNYFCWHPMRISPRTTHAASLASAAATASFIGGPLWISCRVIS